MFQSFSQAHCKLTYKLTFENQLSGSIRFILFRYFRSSVGQCKQWSISRPGWSVSRWKLEKGLRRRRLGFTRCKCSLSWAWLCGSFNGWQDHEFRSRKWKNMDDLHWEWKIIHRVSVQSLGKIWVQLLWLWCRGVLYYRYVNCFCFVVVSLFFNTTFHTSDKRDLVQFVHPSVEYRSTLWSLHAVDISAHTSADRLSIAICRWTVGERQRREVLRSH